MPSLTPEQARRRFLGSRVARLATISAADHPHIVPHIVPVTFADAGRGTLVTAVDHKPKRTTALSRLDNIRANPAVSLLVDRYADDWSQLWWTRADGHAEILETGQRLADRADAVEHLIDRYHQYRAHPPGGDLILITVTRWSGWSALEI